MRVTAARLVAHEAPLVVGEVDLPEPGEGETVVELAYGGVNPVDRYGAQGRVAPDGPVPRTLGGEAAGTVDGRPVLVFGGGLGAVRDGVWASAAVVPRASVVELPPTVELQQAAAIGVAGVTAWRCVTQWADIDSGDRVLVLGASGGVGSAIVSLCHHLGASVWGQTGSPDKAAFVEGQGADRAVVADADGLAEAVRDLEPTVVFDGLGGAFTGASIMALGPRGRLVLYGTSAGLAGEVPLQQLYRKGLSITGYGGLIEPHDALVAGARKAVAAVADGRMSLPVDRVLPLTSANEALQLLADRDLRGKVLLDLRS